ncbi:hypothetical protein V8G54_005367 [Vigna mungo]|uniref:Uncharacterized protein n=1 Tax=Vigna mungo TaxID=3915 RepID=A0AAQ3NXR4_VIGMU
MKLQIVSLFTFKISTCNGANGSSSNITSKLSCGLRKDLGMWNSDCVGFPSGERKLIQWRPMLLPLIHIIPLPIPVILIATGPVPSGVTNLVLYQVRGRGIGLSGIHFVFNDPSSLKTFMPSPLSPTR